MAEANKKILSAGEKIILQRNVECIEFAETEDKLRPFQCSHCGQLALFHVQLKCTHILCQECFPLFHLKRCLANHCNEYVKNTVFDMNCLDYEIGELKAFCKHNKRGCDAIVPLRDLLSHEGNCQFSKIINEIFDSLKEIDELTKCKEEIRNLKRQFAEFQVQFQPLIPLIQDKCLIQNKDIEDFILEKVKMNSAKQRMKLEKQLTGNFEKYIDNKMEIEQNKTETKLLLKYEKDFQNLQEKLLTKMNENRDSIEMSVKNETSKKLKSEVENLKQDLQQDLLTQNEEFMKNVQQTSEGFIEDVVEMKCEEIKKDLSHDLEIKLNKNVKNERTILFNEIKSEVNVKGHEIKSIAIQELNEELTKRLENETLNLERSFNKKYELDKLKMEDDLKKQISSEIHCDIHSLAKRLDVLSPRSLNVIWEIEAFKASSIESEVFHFYEIECKVKFIIHVWSYTAFQVKYDNRPNDEAFPLNGYHRITFILHDQVHNKSLNDFIRIFEPTFQDWTDHTLVTYLERKDDLSFLHSRWLKNGKAQVNVQLEPLNDIIALEPRHYGHIIWKIDHFKDVRESYRRQYSLSEAFYSSEKGYRMKGFLAFDDKVYFRLYFLKGPWDKELPKKFKHRSIVTLISQKDPSELKDETISEETDGTMWEDIGGIPKADLEKYVKDDSLIICFKVEAL